MRRSLNYKVVIAPTFTVKKRERSELFLSNVCSSSTKASESRTYRVEVACNFVSSVAAQRN